MTPSAERRAAPLAVRMLQVLGLALLGLPRWARWIPSACWMALIFVLSMQEFGSGPPSGGAWGIASNGYHCFEYGVLALFLSVFAPREQGWPRLAWRETLVLLVVVMLYAGSDELHQVFVPSRNFSVLDLLSDLVGAWLALAAARRVAGPHADPRRLAWIVAWGIPLCLACASLANWMPQWFPDAAWM